MSNGVATVAVEGELEFGSALEFRTRMTEVITDPATRRIDVDFGGTTYLDSSGLGVLLTSRDLARKNNKEVVLTQCRGSVRGVLNVARFDRLFSIT